MRKAVFFLLLIFLPLSVFAQEEDYAEASDSLVQEIPCVKDSLPWPLSVQAKLDTLLKHPMFETTQVGVMVWDLDADSCIYRHQERQLLRPASTMKVITAITALDRLGGSYQFKTQLKYKGTIANRKLTGNLYCIGGMDPRFNQDDMRALVEGVKGLGIDTISGSIYADRTMKDGDLMGEGWCWDDDNPELSPLLIGRKNLFMEKFAEKLMDANIIVQGLLLSGQCPHDAVLVETRSHSMDQVLVKMMKESDNLYAESMLYQIAASTGHHPATAKHAQTIEKQLISKVGLVPSNYRLADGSGLSLYNYVSAELETRLLRYAYQNDNIYHHLYPSLPIAGVDGTLKKRMIGTAAQRNVHAKTGTLTGIISLAGYCRAANGHLLCFAIINQGVMSGKKARAFQDRVCVALCATQ